jgi:hypothetical protein
MMDNMTGNTCNATGILTLVPINMTGGAQAGNATVEQTDGMAGSQAGANMTGGQTYDIIATVMCMPEAMDNMTGGAQAGNMTGGTEAGNMTGVQEGGNITGAQTCNITGIMTLTPIDMTGSLNGNATVEQTGGMAGNQTGGNMTGGQTYDITATVMCMPEAMNNMTGEAQAGNMTGGSQAGNMTGMDNMTAAKTCYITGTATSMPADMTVGQAGNMTSDQTGNMTGSPAGGNMTEAQTYDISATVTCMPGDMSNMTGAQTGMTGTQAGNMTAGQTGATTGTQTGNTTLT